MSRHSTSGAFKDTVAVARLVLRVQVIFLLSFPWIGLPSWIHGNCSTFSSCTGGGLVGCAPTRLDLYIPGTRSTAHINPGIYRPDPHGAISEAIPYAPLHSLSQGILNVPRSSGIGGAGVRYRWQKWHRQANFQHKQVRQITGQGQSSDVGTILALAKTVMPRDNARGPPPGPR